MDLKIDALTNLILSRRHISDSAIISSTVNTVFLSLIPFELLCSPSPYIYKFLGSKRQDPPKTVIQVRNKGYN